MYGSRGKEREKRKRRLGETWYNAKRRLYEACVECVVDIEKSDQIKLPLVFYLVQKLKALLVIFYEALLEYQDGELEKNEIKLKQIWYEIYEQIPKQRNRPP